MTVPAGRQRRAGTTVPRSPSEALLIACARPAAATEPSREVMDLVGDPDVLWTSTATLAVWQGVAPRLARSLVVSGVATGVPHGVGEGLQSAYLTTMARNLALRCELERVVRELHRHHIDVMLLKGAAMVPGVHRDPGVRPMDDLDLLVHRDDLALADRVVRELGYLPSDSPPATIPLHGSSSADSAPHHLAALVRADGTVTIELHHKLGDSGSPLDFDVAGLWARAVPCTVGGVTCLRPSDEDLLAHVGLHFLVDRARLFSRRALGQLCDLAAILDTFADTLDWDTLTRDAVARGYSRALALALATATAVLDAGSSDDALAALAPNSVYVPNVADTVARRVLRDSAWTTLERLTSRQPSVLHLLPPNPRRWRPRVAEIRPPFGVLDGYARWTGASTRILLHPRDIADERRFAADLQALVYPHGLPDGSRSRRRFRRRVQARLARTPLRKLPPA